MDAAASGQHARPPEQEEKQGEKPEVLRKAGQAVLHPVHTVGGGQHDEGDQEKVHAGLPGEAPAVDLPDQGAGAEACPHQQGKQGLQGHGPALAAGQGGQLGPAGQIAAAAPAQGEQDGDRVADGQPGEGAGRSAGKQFLFHGVIPPVSF